MHDIILPSKYTEEEKRLFEQTEDLNCRIGDTNAPDETDPLKIAPLLSYKEAIEWRQDQMEQNRERHRQEDHEQFLDAKRRMGWVIHHSDFIAKLRQLIPTLIVHDNPMPNRLSIYYVIQKPTEKGNTSYVVYLGWMEMGYMPEYEINLVNEFNEAVGQKRGWRTVLLRLIVRKHDDGSPASIITEKQVEEMFGYPSSGWETATNYRQRLYAFRNNHDR